MSAALDAAATVAIYVAWGIVILGGVIALAAFASRWGLPNLPRRREERPVEGTEEPPATIGSPDWAWPARRPEFDPASYEYRGPGSWDPEKFRGSLAERAVEEVWTRIEIEQEERS